MELEIGGQLRELKFGLGFVRKADELYTIKQNGLEMGMGVNMAYNYMTLYSVGDLAKVIKASSTGSPSSKEVDNAIEKYADEQGDLEPLFDEIIEEMGKSPVLKATIKKFKKMAKTEE
ncbi:MAG: tail assembly chaperone [Staphylococcus equorum]|nr:tail assembly chaperone [Staphylococcus equorum]